MAYNSYFPTGYQPTYYPTQNNAYVPQPTQQSGIIWVQGENAAKSFAVAPNTSVALWDSEANVIYIKSADSAGMPSMKIVDYTMRDNAPRRPETAPQSDFVTKDDILPIQKDIEALKAKLEGRKHDGK